MDKNTKLIRDIKCIKYEFMKIKDAPALEIPEIPDDLIEQVDNAQSQSTSVNNASTRAKEAKKQALIAQTQANNANNATIDAQLRATEANNKVTTAQTDDNNATHLIE